MSDDARRTSAHDLTEVECFAAWPEDLQLAARLAWITSQLCDCVAHKFASGVTTGFCSGIAAGREIPIATVQAELLEDLLDAQDQETDLDGRPIGPPYYVIGDDGTRWFIESALAKIRDSVPAEQQPRASPANSPAVVPEATADEPDELSDADLVGGQNG